MPPTEVAIWLHLATVIPILTFKITVITAGCFIAWLGYKLLICGISGDFTINFKFKDFETNLASGLPGLFFVFLAVLLIGYAVLKDKPFKTNYAENIENNIKGISDYNDKSIDKPKLSETLNTSGNN
jgi:hypothetical protein